MIRRILTSLACVLVLLACGDDSSFRIEGTIEGNPTMNIYFGYYDGTVYRNGVGAAVDGKFTYTGRAPQGTVLDITDLDRRVLGRVYIRDGQSLKLTLNRNDLYSMEATGNAPSSALAEFYTRNGDSLRLGRANSAIASYIRKHPDDITGMVLLGYHYVPRTPSEIVTMDSLIESMSTEARPSILSEGVLFNLQNALSGNPDAMEFQSITYVDPMDTLRIYNPSNSPYGLVSITDNATRDNLSKVHRSLARRYGRRLDILDLSMDTDTMLWHQTLREDSVTWHAGWTAGGIMAPDISRLGVIRLPFYIVTDSTGRQIYRGHSVAKAEETVNHNLK